jgi:hypothetical protein
MKKQSTAKNTTATKAPRKSKAAPVETQATEGQGNEAQQPQLQIDVEYVKTTNIHCVVHCPTGSISENTFISFIKFGNVAKQLGLEWSVETTINETIPARAKNMLAAKFLTLPEKTHLMFVDPDVSFEPWHLLVLLDRKVDVVSGLLPMKTMPVRWSVMTFEGAEELEDGLHEVERVTTGFTLIKRDVFEQLKEHTDVASYANDMGLGQEFDQHLYTYFDTKVVEGKFISEDADFCAKWRSQGGRIWADKRVSLGNKGFFNYSALSQDVLLNSFGPMYLDFLKSNGKVQMIGEEVQAQA